MVCSASLPLGSSHASPYTCVLGEAVNPGALPIPAQQLGYDPGWGLSSQSGDSVDDGGAATLLLSPAGNEVSLIFIAVFVATGREPA